MDKELMKGFKWSLFVHTVLLILLVQGRVIAPTTGGAAQPPQGQSEQDRLAQLPKNEVEVEIIDAPKKSDELTKATDDQDGVGLPAHLNDECPDFFGGIGIDEKINWNDPGPLRVVVQTVHHGYPAEKAGIQSGDELLNSTEIRGEIGTHVLVKTMRNGVPIDYDIVRDKICTTKMKENEP